MAAQIEQGVLYVVATPVGNLGDITFRAVEVLKSVDIIACEDTRTTLILCAKYDIKTRLTSYHKFSENERLGMLLEYLGTGRSIALVSDAGTPLISDPGEILVERVRKEGYQVIPIPGASAVTALLSAISRKSEDFKFIGFLPRVKGQIQKIFFKNTGENLVFYESPNRIETTIEALIQVRPDAKIAIGRELTKKFEQIKFGSAREILAGITIKGEFVCMVYADEKSEDSKEIAQKAQILKDLKLSDKDITNALSALYGFSKNTVKEILYKL